MVEMLGQDQMRVEVDFLVEKVSFEEAVMTV